MDIYIYIYVTFQSHNREKNGEKFLQTRWAACVLHGLGHHLWADDVRVGHAHCSFWTEVLQRDLKKDTQKREVLKGQGVKG